MGKASSSFTHLFQLVASSQLASSLFVAHSRSCGLSLYSCSSCFVTQQCSTLSHGTWQILNDAHTVGRSIRLGEKGMRALTCRANLLCALLHVCMDALGCRQNIRGGARIYKASVLGLKSPLKKFQILNLRLCTSARHIRYAQEHI